MLKEFYVHLLTPLLKGEKKGFVACCPTAFFCLMKTRSSQLVFFRRHSILVRHTAPLKVHAVQAACCCGEPVYLTGCWKGIAGSARPAHAHALPSVRLWFKHQVDFIIFLKRNFSR